MPEGIGKMARRMRARWPRAAKVYDNYHSTITALGVILLVTAIGFAISKATQIGNVKKEASEANQAVVEVKEQSPCLAVSDGHFERLSECRESFNRGVRTLSALQSCRLLQKGASIIVIGGTPIPPVTCIPPHGGGYSRKTQRKAEAKEATKEAVPGFGRNEESQLESETVAPGTGRTKHNPAVTSHPESSSTKKPSHESTQTPSQGHESSSGVSSPESGSGTSSTSAPEASGGSETATGSTVSEPATGAGSPGIEGTPPASPATTVRGGLEEVVGGLGHTVEEATTPLCETGLVGIKVCLH